MHASITNNPGTFFSREAAIDLAASLAEDHDDEWTYKAIHDPKGTGYSRVGIFDEDDHFIDYM